LRATPEVVPGNGSEWVNHPRPCVARTATPRAGSRQQICVRFPWIVVRVSERVARAARLEERTYREGPDAAARSHQGFRPDRVGSVGGSLGPCRAACAW